MARVRIWSGTTLISETKKVPYVLSTLRKYRKYAILIIFLAAAILTPTPDVLNQVLLAGPLLILYEFSIFLVWLVRAKRRKNLISE